MKRLVVIILLNMLACVGASQHIPLSQWEWNIPSGELDVEGSSAAFNIYSSGKSKLFLLNLNEVVVADSVILDGFMSSPKLSNGEVHLLQQYVNEQDSAVRLKYLILDNLLEEIESHPLYIPNLENYWVTGTSFKGDTVIFSGNMTLSGEVSNHVVLSFDRTGFVDSTVIDSLGSFQSHGLIEKDSGFLAWGFPLDSSSNNSATWILQFDRHFAIVDTFQIGRFKENVSTPYGSRLEFLESDLTDFQVLDNEQLLMDGTSRNLYFFGNSYQETNSFLGVFDLSSGQVSDTLIFDNMDSNSFSDFSPIIIDESAIEYIHFSTEGSGAFLDFTEQRDSYLKFTRINSNLEIEDARSYYKDDGIYQRLHSSAKFENGYILFGSEFSSEIDLRCFILVLNNLGEVLGRSSFEVQSTQPIVYPNPTSGSITVKADRLIDLKLFNASGTYLLNSDEYRIDLSAFPSGIYYLHVRATEGSYIRKVIKE